MPDPDDGAEREYGPSSDGDSQKGAEDPKSAYRSYWGFSDDSDEEVTDHHVCIENARHAEQARIDCQAREPQERVALEERCKREEDKQQQDKDKAAEIKKMGKWDFTGSA